jgi:hypothetical protein
MSTDPELNLVPGLATIYAKLSETPGRVSHVGVDDAILVEQALALPDLGRFKSCKICGMS